MTHLQKIKRNILRLIILILAVSLLCSFSLGLKKPAITYKKYEIKKITFKDTKINFIYTVKNSNPVGLKNIKADYKMFLGYRKKPSNTPPAMSGKNIKFNIKAKSVSPFVLPMKINYQGFYKSSSKLTKVILSGKKTIPFVLETTFTLNLKILKFRIPVQTRGELPLPKLKKKFKI